MMAEVFRVTPASGIEVPILLSVPHSGTEFPESLRGEFVDSLAAAPDDTDWFVDKLYDFAPEMGIAMISARISRWVIDLNRNPDEKPLYLDGRLITGLCPTTTFIGEPLYGDKRTQVSGEEVQHRLSTYFKPYHDQVQILLDGLISRHGRVLLWDCHSIRQIVPSIQKAPFPDLILGSADGTSASPGLIEATLGVLDHSRYETRHNYPFKGGYITRHFGRPDLRQHALQLEMTKVNYMDASERKYDETRAGEMRTLLKSVFEKLIDTL
jgi:N-formylglutamate amidohydrolase